ncbi:MAG TPA: nucleotide exchange factor GrpE [Terriglobales bacterium]|nr:nucleotide exchange factor GrpE [Terriglobales bacterium]
MIDDEKGKPSEEIEYIPPAGPAGEEAAKPAAAPGPDTAAPTETPAREEEAASVKLLKEKLKRREAEAKQLKKEMEGLKDQYVRKLADTENLRKRLEREKNDYFQYALGEVLLELLGVLDNFERALQASAGDADGKTFREGIDLIYRMLMNLVLKRDVEPIEIKDGKFDPTLHHAVVVEESADVEEPRVVEVLQKGYLLNGRLLRPALVRVVVPRKKD